MNFMDVIDVLVWRVLKKNQFLKLDWEGKSQMDVYLTFVVRDMENVENKRRVELVRGGFGEPNNAGASVPEGKVW